MAGKEEERKTFEHEYKVYMPHCKKRIEWIFFQGFCSYLVVRAQVIIYSTTGYEVQHDVFAEKIIDCVITFYILGDCSVPSDDKGEGELRALTAKLALHNNYHQSPPPTTTITNQLHQTLLPSTTSPAIITPPHNTTTPHQQ